VDKISLQLENYLKGVANKNSFFLESNSLMKIATKIIFVVIFIFFVLILLLSINRKYLNVPSSKTCGKPVISFYKRILVFLNFIFNYCHSYNKLPPENTLEYKDSIEILKKLFPDNFNENLINEDFTLDKIFPENFDSRAIVLSNLNIKSIPKEIAIRFRNIEELNLSNIGEYANLADLLKHLPRNRLRKVVILDSRKLSNCFQALNTLEKLEELDVSHLWQIEQHEFFKKVLSTLKYLRMCRCNLTSNEVSNICEFGKNLEYLDLNNNGGLFKESFDRLTYNHPLPLPPKLKLLNLSNCYTESYQLLKFLTSSNIEELDLAFGNFSEIGESEIADLFSLSRNEPSLENDLRNQCIGKYMKFNFRNLKSANLDSCKIDSNIFIENLFNIEGLRKLSIATNKFSMNFKKFVECKSMNSLEELNMQAHHLLGNMLKISQIKSEDTPDLPKINENYSLFLKFLSNFSALKKLDISNIQPEKGYKDFSLGSLENSLEDLKINNCAWNDVGFQILAKMKNLRFLEATNNNFGNLPQIINFGFRDTLEEVNLSRTSLNREGFLSFLHCARLKKLIANNCNLEKLSELKVNTYSDSFKFISVNESKLKISDLKLLTSFPNLEELRADKNNFSSKILDGKIFGISSKSLKKVSFKKCELFNQILNEIAYDFENLEILFLNEYKGSQGGNLDFEIENLRSKFKKLEITTSPIQKDQELASLQS
jgi:hypothetical protein